MGEVSDRNVLEALARAPVDDEPLPPELESVLDERIAEVRAGAVSLVQVTVTNEDEEGGTP